MSTQYRIRYSPAALDDLKDIFAYIATELRSPETASKQIHRINDEICSLDFMPCRYETQNPQYAYRRNNLLGATAD